MSFPAATMLRAPFFVACFCRDRFAYFLLFIQSSLAIDDEGTSLYAFISLHTDYCKKDWCCDKFSVHRLTSGASVPFLSSAYIIALYVHLYNNPISFLWQSLFGRIIDNFFKKISPHIIDFYHLTGMRIQHRLLSNFLYVFWQTLLSYVILTVLSLYLSQHFTDFLFVCRCLIGFLVNISTTYITDSFSACCFKRLK